MNDEVTTLLRPATDRDLRRRLFNLAAAVSLMLCIPTAALWARTIGWPIVDEWPRAAGGGNYHLVIRDGRFLLEYRQRIARGPVIVPANPSIAVRSVRVTQV